MNKVNLSEKFSLFSEHWTPKIISELNNYQIKIVKLKGDFVWHDHGDTDDEAEDNADTDEGAETSMHR